MKLTLGELTLFNQFYQGEQMVKVIILTVMPATKQGTKSTKYHMCIITLNPYKDPARGIFSPVYKWENWGSENWGDL